MKSHSIERALYLKSLLDSVYYGASSPFIPIYAVHLGATILQISFLFALSNFTLNLSQILWGYLSDKFRKRILFIILGNIISSMLFIPILLTNSPEIFIVLVIAQSIANSMTIPTFIAYSTEVVDEKKWRRFSSRVNSLTYIGWVMATLTVGLSSHIGFNGFEVGFKLALFCGLMSGLIIALYCGREQRKVQKINNYKHSLILLGVKKNNGFIHFIFISSSFCVFMSLAWPLFTITQTEIASLSLFEISLLDAVSGISGALSLSILERWLCRVSLWRLLTFSSTSLTLLPLFYALTPEFSILFLIHLTTGISSALYDSSILSYIMENTPIEEKGFYTALYNFSTGSAFLVGPFVGGLLLEHLTSILPLAEAIVYVYIISAAGRLLTGLLYLTFKHNTF
ncbi:MAG: MFS transporter [Nitrososphaerota archaeon]